MESRKAVTILDVALAAGVSKTAVSSAMSGNGRLSTEKREEILRVARELRFEVNPHAQRLSRGGCHNTIGLLTLGLDSGVSTQKLQMIQRLLSARGFDVPLYAYGAYGAGEEVNPAQLIRALCQGKPRAIVCAVRSLEDEAQAELESYLEQGGAAVCYDTAALLPCDTVFFDREHSTYEAARHLLDLGHRDLGLFINGLEPPSGDRLIGFGRALEEFGGRTRAEWMFHGLFEAGGQEMAARFVEMNRRPSGVCIINDNAALAFMSEVQRAGWRVPEDVSVIGHGDLPIARYGVVPLSAMSHPTHEIAHRVVEMLCSRLEGRYHGLPRQAVVRGELVRRHSTAAPA